MNKIKKVFSFLIPSLVFLPVVAFAQILPSQSTDATDVLVIVKNIINTIIPIAIALGVVYFIFGVIKYVTAKDDKSKQEARDVMIYGIIGLFVIVSIWGLVAILNNTFGVGQGGTIQNIPGVID
ncbi:MAG: hypothetical protein WDK96_03115 [Candidatus Paceibacterota bacterium]|jgi:hypothetical protein